MEQREVIDTKNELSIPFNINKQYPSKVYNVLMTPWTIAYAA
jgi:hypothetical protein